MMDIPDMGIRITSTQGYDSFESFVWSYLYNCHICNCASWIWI